MSQIKLTIVIDGKEALTTLDATQKEIDELIASFKKTKDSGTGVGAGLVDGLTNARNAMQGFQEVYGVISDVFGTPFTLALDAEQAQISFEVMLGSAEAAKIMLSDLKTFAAVTPFEFPDISKNAQLLLNFGIEANNIIPYLKMLGDVSGGNAEKLSSLSLVFAQVASSGKLMGGDLLQMIGAGFNPLQVMSEKTGKSMGELKDEVSAGRISFDLVKEAFIGATSEGGRFFGMMDKQSASGAGLLSTLSDNIGVMQTAFGSALNFGISPIVIAVSNFIGKINQVSPALGGVIAGAGALTTALMLLQVTGLKANLAGLVPMIINTTTLRAAMQTASLQMNLASMSGQVFAGKMAAASIAVKGFFASLGPIGWVSLAVGALATAFSLFGDSAEEVNQEMSETEKDLRLNQREFQSLTDKLQDNNLKNDERKRILDEINQKYPGYLGNINLEKTSNEELSASIKKINGLYIKKMDLQILEDKLREARGKQLDSEEKMKNIGGPSFWDYVKGSVTKQISNSAFDEELQNYKTAAKEVESITKRMDVLAKDLDKTPSPIVNDTSVGAYTNKLKKEIEALNGEYDKLDITDKAGQSRVLNLIKSTQKELDSLSGKTKTSSSTSKSIDDLKKYYDQVKFADSNYYDFRKKLMDEEITSFKKSLGDKFNETTFRINKEKALQSEYFEWIKKNNPLLNELLSPQGELPKAQLPMSFQSFGNGPLPYVPEVELPVPVSETTQQIVDHWASKSKLMESITDNSVNMIAEMFGQLRIRVKDDADFMTVAFANFGNAVLQTLQKMVAEWIVLNVIVAGFSALTGGATSFLGGLFGKISPIGGGSFEIPTIAGAASGAIVTRPTLMMVGEGSESEGVFPLSYLTKFYANNQRAPQPININLSGKMDMSFNKLRMRLDQLERNVLNYG